MQAPAAIAHQPAALGDGVQVRRTDRRDFAAAGELETCRSGDELRSTSGGSTLQSLGVFWDGDMALELRPNCEYCDKDLPPDAGEARICSLRMHLLRRLRRAAFEQCLPQLRRRLCAAADPAGERMEAGIVAWPSGRPRRSAWGCPTAARRSLNSFARSRPFRPNAADRLTGPASPARSPAPRRHCRHCRRRHGNWLARRHSTSRSDRPRSPAPPWRG